MSWIAPRPPPTRPRRPSRPARRNWRNWRPARAQEDIAMARAQLEQAEQAWTFEKNGPRKEDIDAAQRRRHGRQRALKAIDGADRGTQDRRARRRDHRGLRPAPRRHGRCPTPRLCRCSTPAGSGCGRSCRRIARASRWGRRSWSRVDSYPGREFAGHVAFIARQAEFTPSNVQTPEKRSLAGLPHQGLPGRGAGRAAPGMPADVWLGGTGRT